MSEHFYLNHFMRITKSQNLFINHLQVKEQFMNTCLSFVPEDMERIDFKTMKEMIKQTNGSFSQEIIETICMNLFNNQVNKTMDYKELKQKIFYTDINRFNSL